MYDRPNPFCPRTFNTQSSLSREPTIDTRQSPGLSVEAFDFRPPTPMANRIGVYYSGREVSEGAYACCAVLAFLAGTFDANSLRNALILGNQSEIQAFGSCYRATVWGLTCGSEVDPLGSALNLLRTNLRDGFLGPHCASRPRSSSVVCWACQQRMSYDLASGMGDLAGKSVFRLSPSAWKEPRSTPLPNRTLAGYVCSRC